MARLFVHVEGLTEERFVNSVLAPHLAQYSGCSVSARLLGNARLRAKRGGIRPWESTRKDILNHLRQDPGCHATTMVDYYALPSSGSGAWPGRGAPQAIDCTATAKSIEHAIKLEVSAALGEAYDHCRFIPYVVIHEFEGLLFSDCGALSEGLGRQDLAPDLQAIRDSFATPEEINDSPITAPSKRVAALVQGYRKPIHGTLAAELMGLETIRRECPHFREWLGQLELIPR